MGGFATKELWHDHGFGALAAPNSSYFNWLPLPIQLKLAGFDSQAQELQTLTDEIANIQLMELSHH